VIVYLSEYILFESVYTSVSVNWFIVLVWAEFASQLVMFIVVFSVVSRREFTAVERPDSNDFWTIVVAVRGPYVAAVAMTVAGVWMNAVLFKSDEVACNVSGGRAIAVMLLIRALGLEQLDRPSE
jgi:hypothetical protein